MLGEHNSTLFAYIKCLTEIRTYLKPGLLYKIHNMRILLHILTLLSFVVTTGCSSTVKLISEANNPYFYQPNVAVILIGSVGEAKLSAIKAETKDELQNFEVSPDLSKLIDVYAWKMKVGESFQLSGVKMSRLSHAEITQKFRKSHILAINKEGIYYYGTLLNKNENILLIKKSLPEIIKRANKKYPYTFNILKPINFK